MSEKEEIRRKLAEVDELRARIKELENNPVNSWWSPKNRRENRKIVFFALAWVALIIVMSGLLQLNKLPFYPVILFVAAVLPALIMEIINRRRR